MALVFMSASCGSEGSEGGPDAGERVDAADTVDPVDAADPGDAPTADATPDGGGPSCDPRRPLPEDPPDPEQTKFALTLFHFNLQYVIGGLEFVDDDGVTHTMLPGTAGWDAVRVEDWIIRETFAPVVDFYLAHPQWKANIELQAYLLDVLAERFPEVLEKLRAVAERGQVEVMSFHYSDQLFLAFPREDLRRSIAATKATFERHCVPLAASVFDQEGQAGEGRQAMLVDEGYGIGVYPKNLWRYQYDEAPYWPYYESRGGDLVVGPGAVDPASGIEVEWPFFDDGELLAVPAHLDPYAAPATQYDPAQLEAFAATLTALEADGFRISHVADYVRHLKARGVERRPAPPLLDGTWQPPSTDSVHRWLGGRGNLWWQTERDNAIRTGNAQARTELLLASTLLDHATAEGLTLPEVAAALATAWNDLWMAEVSDTSGINPWEGEVVFGDRKNRAVLAAAETAIAELKTALDTPWVRIATQSGEVEALADRPVAEAPPEIAPPVAIEVRADGRSVEERWVHIGGPIPHEELSLTIGAVTSEGDDTRLVTVAFPRTEDRILYSPALLDDELADLPFDLFAWPMDEVYLPLANGLVGLGNDRWLVKDTRAVHIAVRIRPDTAAIAFIDETAPSDAPFTWRFLYVEGSAEDALALANARNVWPEETR